ncbi:PrgI family protein [Patescibacteria group bacterium]|nr:PrgI family protein [Patescibacteria group bacterium]
MMHNVPQFIDTEDKIVGPFTAKQLGWFFGAGVILLILWNLLEFIPFIIAALFVAAIAGAFAFYRPNGQSFLKFIISMVFFGVRPKIYVWKRDTQSRLVLKKAPAKKPEAGENLRKKALNQAKIQEISSLLDNPTTTWKY